VRPAKRPRRGADLFFSFLVRSFYAEDGMHGNAFYRSLA